MKIRYVLFLNGCTVLLVFLITAGWEFLLGDQIEPGVSAHQHWNIVFTATLASGVAGAILCLVSLAVISQRDRAEGQLEEQSTQRERAETALKQSEKSLSQAQRVAKLAYWRWSFSTRRLTSWSRDFPGLYGLTDEEVDIEDEGQFQFVHPEDRDDLKEVYKAATPDHPSFDVQYRIIRPDREIRYLREVAEPESDSEGRVMAHFGIIQDVTEQRQTETALRETRDLLMAILDHAPAQICLKDLEGHYIMVNHETQRLYGKALAGKTAHDLFPAETANEHCAHDLEVVKSRRAVTAEYNIYEIETLRTYLSVKFPIFDSTDNVSAIGAITTDITDRKKAEEALRESEKRLRQATEVAGLGYCVWDSIEDNCLYCSTEYAHIHGTTYQDYMARASNMEGEWSFTHPEDRETYKSIIEKVRQGSDQEIEYRVVWANGETRHVREIIKPVFDDSGTVIQEYTAILDITDRKQTETALRQAYDTLEHRVEERTAELRAANEALTQEVGERKQAEATLRRSEERLRELQSELLQVSRLSSMGELASSLAHELNQPLTAIMNYLQIVRRQVRTTGDPHLGEAGEMIAEAIEQTDRAGSVIRNLRNFIEQGRTIRSEIDINEVIKDASSLGLIGAAESGIATNFDLSTDLPPAFVDMIQIQQVLLNLVRNAVEAMADSERRELTVTSAKGPEGFAEINVSDTGPGLSKDIAGQLFQPFTTSKPEGIGLGLSISRSIVEAHGGRLWVVPKPEGGTEFHFTVPVAPEHESR